MCVMPVEYDKTVRHYALFFYFILHFKIYGRNYIENTVQSSKKDFQKENNVLKMSLKTLNKNLKSNKQKP